MRLRCQDLLTASLGEESAFLKGITLKRETSHCTTTMYPHSVCFSEA